MTAQLAPDPVFRAIASNGSPLSQGQLFSYIAGTTIPQATYPDSTMAAPNTNPVILNSRGECALWLDPAKVYKLNLLDTQGNQIPGWPVDNISGGSLSPSGSIIPTANNLFTLGSPTSSFANLYLGADDAPALGTSGNVGYYKRTAAEIAASVTPKRFEYAPLDPLRYGAVGNGDKDDTDAMNDWATVINHATGPVSSVWTAGNVYLCGPIVPASATSITANDVTIFMNGCTIKVKPGSAGIQLNFTGLRTRLYAGTIDGNQAAYGSSQVVFLLVIGNDFLLVDMTLKNSPLIGMQLANVSRGTAIGCHFDHNANSGMQLSTCSYLKFEACTFNFNGWGFQVSTYPLNGPGSGAFSCVLRFQCHHLTFVNCENQQSGSDGFNTNQGSYAIKYIGCLVWGATDGGFTIAADSTQPGAPGDAQSCYDLEYIDCEAYNNWASGVTAFAPVYNVTIEGGRYYNNGRAAGILPFTTAAIGGIYITGGSQGIRIRTKCYDDRQIVPITGVVLGSDFATLTCNSGPNDVNPSWVRGTMGTYPRVALYDPSRSFKGYGTIISEAANILNIVTTANNGVPLASITPGWFVSQRVQHNGAFFDNDSQGEMAIDGFGFLPGPAEFQGYKSAAGYFAPGQNVLLPAAQLDYTELLANPTWDAGTGAGVTWNYNLSGGGLANPFSTAGTLLRSPGCLQLISGSSAAFGDSVLITNGTSYVTNCWIEASCWVHAENPGDAAITVFYNTPSGGLQSTTVTHSGGGWRQLKIGAFLGPKAPTQLFLRVISAVRKTNYFDTASLRVKSDSYDNRDFSYPTRNLPV